MKLTLRTSHSGDIAGVMQRLERVAEAQLPHQVRDTHVVMSVPAVREAAIRAELAGIPGLSVVGAGRRMEIFKEVGRPDEVAARIWPWHDGGTHAIGHTRMATESAVTTERRPSVHDGPRPVPGAQWLAVQPQRGPPRADAGMGWRSKPKTTRRSPPASSPGRCAKAPRWKQAMEASLDALDGFYTFVIGTETGFGVLRDPIACKPAVMAETDRWVAFGTEYRALVDLPGIDDREGVGAGAGQGLPLGTALMPTVDLATRPLRELNAALHRLRTDTNETHWRVLNPRGQHSIAVGHRCAGPGRDRRPCRLLLRRHEQARAR